MIYLGNVSCEFFMVKSDIHAHYDFGFIGYHNIKDFSTTGIDYDRTRISFPVIRIKVTKSNGENLQPIVISNRKLPRDFKSPYLQHVALVQDSPDLVKGLFVDHKGDKASFHVDKGSIITINIPKYIQTWQAHGRGYQLFQKK